MKVAGGFSYFLILGWFEGLSFESFIGWFEGVSFESFIGWFEGVSFESFIGWFEGVSFESFIGWFEGVSFEGLFELHRMKRSYVCVVDIEGEELTLPATVEKSKELQTHTITCTTHQVNTHSPFHSPSVSHVHTLTQCYKRICTNTHAQKTFFFCSV